ncbi:MAG TPA: 5'-nucleotidase C-terminal domain-containing protein [Candidatus Angelobacter sp.]|nr:5'-nucleotidase C-terminal domain-containing protein [Candidatus Angelobacter sp.]
MTVDKSTLSWCILTIVLFSRALSAQQVTVDTEAPLEAQSRADITKGEKMIRILYTGKLFGYFRDPNWQAPNETGFGCSPDSREEEKSVAAYDFDRLLAKKHVDGAILVGAGDNFAPELGARDFCSPPPLGKYPTHFGKELYVWDDTDPNKKRWISNEELRQNQQLAVKLQAGQGSIPTDNVAKFFIDEGYAALVPGKHDFHFGPERLRELARYLSKTSIPVTPKTVHAEHVQMLGVNLVIETTWTTDHAPLSDKKLPPKFIPRFPTGTDLVGPTDSDVKLVGLSDKASVYPFFQGPTVQLQGPAKSVADLDALLQQTKFYLCKATISGDPNSIPRPTTTTADCTPISLGAGDNKHQLQFPWESGKEFETLVPGGNYGLCALPPNSSTDDSTQDKRWFCVRFSVYRPFFDGDPRPYVLLEAAKKPELARDVAIFGVVDPGLGERVGLSNFAWLNSSNKFKTRVAVKDPAEALQQLLAAFKQKYEDEHKNGPKGASDTYGGIKVLLAQMTPQQADVLAMRFSDSLGGFQVAVSAADLEMATVNDASTTEWNAAAANAAPESTATSTLTTGVEPTGTPEAEKRPNTRHYPRYLAIPAPYYNPNSKPKPKWIVDIGSLSIRFAPGPLGKWTLVSYHMKGSPNIQEVAQLTPEASAFWTQVNTRLNRDCLPSGLRPKLPAPLDVGQDHERANQIQLLTLCYMQKSTEADVALLQKRDFFSELPTHTIEEGPAAIQDFLDRIIWKEDFLSLLYVPGSALKKAMEQSKLFDADDKSDLSLSAEKQRSLVSLGISFDSERGEYVINGLPLDPNKLYSVATSDFLEAGDTGYPDLATSQQEPPVTPRDFDKNIRTISSVVCEQLAKRVTGSEGHADARCLGSLNRDAYFDSIVAAPSDIRNGNTASQQLETWSVFYHPSRVPGNNPPRTVQEQADQQVEQRALWDLNISKWTLGITALGHNGTDFDVQNNFGGTTTSGVNAFRSSTWTSDFQAQWTRSWRRNQIFMAPAYTYNVQNKGQPDDVRQINQITDLGMVDQGYVHTWSDRGPEHYDSLLTVHFETPLTQSFQAFTLATNHTGPNGEPIKDQIRFNLDRSYTVLLRPGFRWKRRISSVEIGPEWGHEWNALQEVDFFTNGVMVPCAAKENVSVSQCVKSAVKANPQAITPASDVETRRLGQDHAGVYWKLNLTVPFHPRVSYVLTDAGDSFFVHYNTDNSTGTLFRDYSQHQLKFTIFPSFSIGPELDLLFFENKSVGQQKGHFLRQQMLIMKAQFSFDLFNHRKLEDQVVYAPPASPGAK